MLAGVFVRRGGRTLGETYALLHEDGELSLILNVDELLAAVGGVGDVELLERRWVSTRFLSLMRKLSAVSSFDIDTAHLSSPGRSSFQIGLRVQGDKNERCLYRLD